MNYAISSKLNIVVAATRVSAGEGYQEHLKQMLVAVVEGIED